MEAIFFISRKNGHFEKAEVVGVALLNRLVASPDESNTKWPTRI